MRRLESDSGRIVERDDQIIYENFVFYSMIGIERLDWSPIGELKFCWLERTFEDLEISKVDRFCYDSWVLGYFNGDLLQLRIELSMMHLVPMLLIPINEVSCHSLHIGFLDALIQLLFYAILANISSARPREIIGNTITISYGAFFEGRNTLFVALFGNTAVDEYRSLDKKGIILRDFEKAYDYIMGVDRLLFIYSYDQQV